MPKPWKPWSDEDTQTAREMLARRADPAEFMAVLRRTKNAAKDRIQWVDNPNVREKCADRSRERRSRRREMGLGYEGGRSYVIRSDNRPPDEVLAAAAARMNAPRSLTAALFGDPPKGFSALDKKLETA